MSQRARVVVFLAVVVVIATAATAYAVRDSRRYQEVSTRPPAAKQAPITALPEGPRIAFRHTGLDSKYGTVAVVAARRPRRPPAFTDVTCDRVDATADGASCLRTKRGVVTKFERDQLAPDWTVVDRSPLPGIPSRTRLSADGTLVASTTFVSGHSYMQVGFSTATEIREVDGRDYGNLEKFQLVIDGRDVAPNDRNIWGVTFRDDRPFYATVGTGGRTYLVAGDLADRTLTSVTENAECPSLSPDGTRVAFKVDVAPGDRGLEARRARPRHGHAHPARRQPPGPRRPGRVARRRHPALRAAARRRGRRDRRVVPRRRPGHPAAAAHRAGLVTRGRP